MDDRAGVVGGDLYGGVRRAGGGATDEDGGLHIAVFHFLGDVDHFVE